MAGCARLPCAAWPSELVGWSRRGGRLDEMSSVWEEERRETGAAASPPPPSPRPPLRSGVTLGMRQILNGSCKVTSEEEEGGGGGGGRARWKFIRALTWLASSHRALSLLVLVFVCAPPPLSIRNAQSERRCLSSMYVYGVGVRGIPCFSQRGERPRRGRLTQLRHGFALRTCMWRMGREREDARLIGNERVTLRNLRERRQ